MANLAVGPTVKVGDGAITSNGVQTLAPRSSLDSTVGAARDGLKTVVVTDRPDSGVLFPRTRSGVRKSYIPSPVISLPFRSMSVQDFADYGISFSRTSHAMMIDSSGKMTFAPHNLQTYSNDFSNAGWTKYRCTVAAGGVNPYGVAAQYTVQTSGQTTVGLLGQASASHVGDSRIIHSVYAKAKEKSILIIGSDGTGSAGANQYSYFDLEHGVVGQAFASHQCVIETIGDGWYRCSIIFTVRSAGGNVTMLFGGADTAGSLGVTADGGVYLHAAQTERLTYETAPRTYIPTTTAVVYGPRVNFNPVTLKSRGLQVEEARTNLCTFSSKFTDTSWAVTSITKTDNVVLAPDGTISGAKIAEQTSGSAVHYIYKDYGAAPLTAGTYAYSIYVKAAERNFATICSGSIANTDFYAVTLDLRTGAVTQVLQAAHASDSYLVEPAANGWWRVTVIGANERYYVVGPATQGTFASPASYGFESYAGVAGSGIYVWGSQIELGAFSTSYIPTTSATVARSADYPLMNGTPFTSVYNQSEGTFVIQFDSTKKAAQIWPLIVDFSGGGSSYIDVTVGANGKVYGRSASAGAMQSNIDAGDAVNREPTRVVHAYKLDNFAVSKDGGAVSVDGSGTPPTNINTLWIGQYVNNYHINGHITEVLYYNQRIPDSYLPGLSTLVD